MKPLQIGLLVVAGALGGAVVMKVWQRPQPAAFPAPVVAQVETPAPAAAPEPVPVEPPAVEPAPAAVKPAPFAAPAPAEPAIIQPKRVAPVRLRRPSVVRSEGTPHPQLAARPQETVRPQKTLRPPDPVLVAKSEPAPLAAPAPVPEPQQAPPPTPPARTDPENVTPPPPPPEPEPEPPRVTLNAGMLIPVRLVDGLSSERNMPGDTFTATLYRELVADGFVIAERGARVEGRVVASDRGGKGGASMLSVELTRLYTSDGQDVAIQTDSFERRLESSQVTNAEKIGGGAAVGAIIGAIAGGGKGAAIGAGVGGGAGAGDVLLTHGRPATLPSETRITFRLRAPVTLTEKRS